MTSLFASCFSILLLKSSKRNFLRCLPLLIVGAPFSSYATTKPQDNSSYSEKGMMLTSQPRDAKIEITIKLVADDDSTQGASNKKILRTFITPHINPHDSFPQYITFTKSNPVKNKHLHYTFKISRAG